MGVESGDRRHKKNNCTPVRYGTFGHFFCFIKREVLCHLLMVWCITVSKAAANHISYRRYSEVRVREHLHQGALLEASFLTSPPIEMSATVLATDILPSLYDNDEDLNGTRESHEDVMDDLNYDIYNLAAFNYHSVRITGEGEEREEAILNASIRATQLLVKRLGPSNSTRFHTNEG